jgi:hypothetical protein
MVKSTGKKILRVVGVICLPALLVAAIVAFVLAGEPRAAHFLTRISILLWVRVAAVLVAIVAIGLWIRIGYASPWTGFGEEESGEEGTKPKAREARPRKTLWDWLQLGGILAVPIAITFFGTWFTVQQAQQSQKIEDQRAEAEQKLAEQRAQYERLQAYLDQMTTLYLQKDLSDEKVRTLLRSRTLTVLESLGPDGPDLEQGPRHKRTEHALRHKRIVMTFLSEASLINKDNPVVDLKEANLSDANLTSAYLNGARGWTEKQLRAAQSLKGATMPDGQTLRGPETPNGPTFEAWLKDKKSRGED